MFPSPRRAAAAVAIVTALCVSGKPAAAGLEVTEYGPRAGFQIDPDQFTIGAIVDLGEVADFVHFAPSGDVGFGDHIFTLSLNPDFFYNFQTSSGSVTPYAGGGLGFTYYRFDIPEVVAFGQKIGGGSTSTSEIGLNLAGGIKKSLGGYKTGSIEVRLGIGDLPDVKITAALGFQ